jgi:archaemetzincin
VGRADLWSQREPSPRWVGDFSEAQRRALDLTQDYLALFFDAPVRVRRQIALASIPARARRTHPSWGDQQVLSGYVLHEVLEPERPADALAYLALTASDLWPGQGWNFVFGEANLRQRTGVWSVYRNGDPGGDFTPCLRRALGTASHELCHVLTMRHCTAFRCLMNGSNHQGERDARPLHKGHDIMNEPQRKVGAGCLGGGPRWRVWGCRGIYRWVLTYWGVHSFL